MFSFLLILNSFVFSAGAANEEYNYSDSSVLVTLKKQYSVPGSKYDASFFDEELFSDAEDLMNYNPNKKGKGGHKSENWYIILRLILKEPGCDNVEKVIKLLKKHKAVKNVEKNYYFELDSESSFTIPNDTYFSNQYGLELIEAKRAWSITKGSSSVKVGVIDTGINRTNTDLTANTGSVLSMNFTTQTSLGYWHGTHVAGIIGANTNNSSGIAGVCWNVSLIDLRVSNASSVPYDNIVDAITYATEYDIPIINLSISSDTGKDTFYTAISNYDGLIIASAGNNGSSTLKYPAAYNFDNLLIVAATDSTDTLWEDSNYNSTGVDVAAPGVGIYSTHDISGTTFEASSGTSFATPYVTGIAALMLSVNPNLTAVEIKEIIMETVDVVPALSGKCVSGGRVNAFNAVMAAGGFILGDIDCSGTVDSTDSRLAMRYAVGLETFTKLQMVLADMDANGCVDSSDSRLIERLALGL